MKRIHAFLVALVAVLAVGLSIVSVQVVAEAEEPTSYPLRFGFEVDPAGTSLSDAVDSLTVNGESWEIPAHAAAVTKQIPAGTTVTVTATPNTGYRFVRWEKPGLDAPSSSAPTRRTSSPSPTTPPLASPRAWRACWRPSAVRSCLSPAARSTKHAS